MVLPLLQVVKYENHTEQILYKYQIIKINLKSHLNEILENQKQSCYLLIKKILSLYYQNLLNQKKL